MSLLQDILQDKESPAKAKQLAYLIEIIRKLGWSSLGDQTIIKPSLRPTILYIRKHKVELSKLFGDDLVNANRSTVLEVFRTYLFYMWHVDIVEDSKGFRLQLLKKVLK